MAPTKISTFPCRFAEGFYSSAVTTPHAWPLRTFLPIGYEPNYPYPLLVFLHGTGSSEEQILRLAPRLSRRNYVCIAPRGPMSLEPASDGVPRYSWGAEDFDDPQIEQYVFRCIEQTRRSYHIHSERIYLVGFREGAALAYRLGLLYPERFGGVVSVNGRMPRVGRPRLRLPEVRSLRVLIQHGIDNNEISADDAKQDAKLFYSAGMPVEMRTYATTHRIHADMLRGIDSWIQDHISEEFDLLAE